MISLAQMNSRHGARPLVRLIKTRKTFWLEPFRFSNFSASLCNIHIYIYTYIYSFRCTIVCTYVRTIVRRVVQEYFTVEIVQALLSFFFFSSFFFFFFFFFFLWEIKLIYTRRLSIVHEKETSPPSSYKIAEQVPSSEYSRFAARCLHVSRLQSFVFDSRAANSILHSD